ncbi:uncharacterized protein LOC117181705 [Belonocnema kinseyi]|uniref:uncharacterized protein LOC117181705 n=1 Tax=Belonocnema kinseyi TaxID=2817044 RepID=UPI00143CD2BA|nr:uncharacterized protein LOC117181705 [Belonocnema kinseyi]
MNQNRNASNQERDDAYQNVGRGNRSFQNRQNGNQNHPNLNPNYQNPVDLIRNYQRYRQQQEPEENIYERLDNDDENDDVEVLRNENLASLQNSSDNHTYERIDDRSVYRAGPQNRNNLPIANNLPGPNVLNEIEARNFSHYDQPRNLYLESARTLRSQFCPYQLGRLARNCFSTENITYASYRRYVYQVGRNCSCPVCRHLCHQCFNMHDRLRYQDPGNSATLGSSRNYIYQVARSCKCTFCRGEFPYSRFPINSNRLVESLRRECECRDPGNCPRCLSSNSAIYIGRFDQSVNNPIYGNPTIYIGRAERSCASGLNSLASGGVSANADSASASASTSGSNSTSSSNPVAVSSASNESTSSSARATASQNVPSSSAASVYPVNNAVNRHHICDDSCIRNQGNLNSGVCQFLERCERAECQHAGRLSLHWWFVNKWLPSWVTQNADRNSERNVESNPKIEEPPEQPDSDSEDP